MTTSSTPAAKRRPGAARKTQKRAPTRQRNRFPDLDLLPGFKDRLILQMDDSEIPARQRVSRLREWTGCSASTARRWIDEEPGLPDLESFTRLCQRFQADANWMLGLDERRMPLPEGVASVALDQAQIDDLEWAAFVRKAVGAGLKAYVMEGDEMEPRIRAGDIVFVDTSVDRIVGNGTYLIQMRERTVVRTVEDRLHDGLVLRCANPQYGEIALDAATVASGNNEFVVKGRVRRSLSLFSL